MFHFGLRIRIEYRRDNKYLYYVVQGLWILGIPIYLHNKNVFQNEQLATLYINQQVKGNHD